MIIKKKKKKKKKPNSQTLFLSMELNLEHLCPSGFAGFVHSTTHKYGKLGLRARKRIFIRYSDSSKGYVMYGEHPNRGMTEIVARYRFHRD
jgi:hypothetical protein